MALLGCIFFIARIFFPIKTGKNKEKINKLGEKNYKKETEEDAVYCSTRKEFQAELFFYGILYGILTNENTCTLSFSNTRRCVVVNCGKRTWYIIFRHFVTMQLFIAHGLTHSLPQLCDPFGRRQE